MSRISRLAAHVVGSVAVVAVVSSSVFAEHRPSRETTRRDDRGRSSDRYDSRRHDGRRELQYFSGRVSRYERHRDGYRLWIGGAPYPFYVPSSRWHRSPFRVGVSVRIGGYYNPEGYYDYYEDGGYSDRGGYAREYASGYVESIDYRGGRFVIQEARSRRLVTVLMRNRDRFFDDLRRGDFVELSGDWTRGVFEAYRIDDVDRGRR
jgi:hypothetical protein